MDSPKGVFFFFSMLDNFNMLMEQGKTQSAYDYLNAIRNYAVDGTCYEGSDLTVQLLMNGDMKVIDSVQLKREKGKLGGKANTNVSLDEKIYAAIEKYTFKTKTALVDFVEGKRTTVLNHLQRMGITDDDWLDSSQQNSIMEREPSNGRKF